MSKKKITVCLPWSDAFGGGDYYELVPNSGAGADQQTLVLKPIKQPPHFQKMTKAELIEYIENLDD